MIFSIDMRQLLTGLGMKTADIDRIMATAAANAKKSAAGSHRLPSPICRAGRSGTAVRPGADRGAAAAGGGRSGAGADGGGGARRAEPRLAAGRRRCPGGAGPGRRRGGFGNMSDEDRQKMRDLRQKMQAATGRRPREAAEADAGPDGQGGNHAGPGSRRSGAAAGAMRRAGRRRTGRRRTGPGRPAAPAGRAIRWR